MSVDPSRHICRIADIRGGFTVGTVVLVSDQGGEFGYGLTCWHNFDPEHWERLSGDKQIDGVYLVRSVAAAGPEHRRPVTVVGQWSNVSMDVAVLKIPRAVIVEFDLQPVPITFDLRRRMRLAVVGFQRPGALRHADRVEVSIVSADRDKYVEGWDAPIRVFEATSADGRTVPFDAGMSGGAMIDVASGALAGLAAVVDWNETGGHRYAAYGISMDTVSRSWPVLADYCRVKRPRRWGRATVTAAAALVGAGLLIRLLPWCLAPRPDPHTGKWAGRAATFSVHRHYAPSGKMGDAGDLTIGKGGGEDGGDRFVYEAAGTGPHEWEHTHDQTVDQKQPARFAGVTYLSPAGCWGQSVECGYDLRAFRRLHWEARSANALAARVEFFVGTDSMAWRRQNTSWNWARVPFPGSAAVSFGTHELTQAWRPFDVELVASESRRRVVGGFGWVMRWQANGIDGGAGSRPAKPFVIEIRNIRYEGGGREDWRGKAARALGWLR